MKTIKFLAAALFLSGMLLTLPACNKYEDGPSFSLLSKKKRLEGSWDLASTTNTDGTTFSDNSSDYFTYKKDGTCSWTSGNVSVNGTWEFGSGKETLLTTFPIPFTNSETTTAVTITRLSDSELWTKDSDGKKYKFDKK